MTYSATLAYIMEQLPMYQRTGMKAYRSGLDNTIKLDDYFGHPHSGFKTIHIAGTNGKGSVSHMLASVFQQAGYKTGLYTSPHLVDFRERIRVNGKMISKKFVTEFISRHKHYFQTFDPSFFEISVFMAFMYFAGNKVDVAVIETGLGGRLDATNIISPQLAVITNIGKDHMEILGNTPAAIAAEKAGIIKKNTPVVIGESQPETKRVFMDFASNLDAPITFADKIYRIDYSLFTFDDFQVFNVIKGDEIRYANLKCGLLGHYQRKNMVTLLASVDILKAAFPKIGEKEIYEGVKNVISNTGLQGRWQMIRSNPGVICDTAHNADGLRLVLQQVNETPFRKLHLILGFVNDKEITGILKYMPAKAFYYFVRLSVPRTMDEKILESQAARAGLKGTAFPDIKNAYESAIKNAETEDLIVITGSNFLVADFLNYRQTDSI